MEDVARVMARGLIAIPSELRKKLGLKEGDLVKIQVEGDKLIIRKEARVYDLKGRLATSEGGSVSFAQVLQEELKKKWGRV
ncbi:transcriptional regulator, AbrB family [Thermocrinis albus DSM 14484]|uniref:Transcriptional regulator, AbrB family n=1 Tax=Thermocrinis albus (strain DSM 14484 / JCM 11386 / HI 11/12) TaxID=638303 RepID=D3SP98_THEAH|nr:AbrB/MazE/SpoVT family DNA-binding domain-containing protein [Thermocrinis albus]ADC88985.1 transcriptional regulator, AbrB family [Thermocrinis albus DSM 14484]